MTATKDVSTRRKTLPELLNDDATQKRFEGMLGKDARSFQQNILTVYNGSKQLQECDPESIIAACAISASINLSILPSLGQSCVVPYKDGDRLVATWQIQWKGLVQLAHRTAQYHKINLARVYDGQLVRYDEFKGEVELKADGKKSDRVIGYYFFFKLNTGFTHEAYWPAKKCVEHGLRYSKSFQGGKGKWTEDPEFVAAGTVKKWLAGKEHFLTEGSGADAMSAKTAVKNDLNRWGPLETRIKEIIALDQAAIGHDGTPRYIDTTAEAAAEPKTYTAPPMHEKTKETSAGEKIAWVRDAAAKQGVPGEQFDAWLVQNVQQDNPEKDGSAATAKAAWVRVTKGEKAADVFALKTAEKEKSIPEEHEVAIAVESVATTDLDGDDEYHVIKDPSQPPIKHYTKDPDIVLAAQAVKGKDGKFLPIAYTERKSGKTTIRMITRLTDQAA